VTRLAFALALLVGGLALSQPSTYFVPIVEPRLGPVGAVRMGTSIWLPDPGVDPSASQLFGFGNGSLQIFPLSVAGVGGVTNVPAEVDAIATAPGVLVSGSSRTLIAVLSNGGVSFYTIDSSGTGSAFVARGPQTGPIDAGTQIALSAVPGGAAALLVADGSRITRFEVDMSSGQAVVSPGGIIPAHPSGATDTSNALVFDGINNIGFVGGSVLGDIYQFDPRLDAGAPSAFDIALTSGGRLASPVTGLALYSVTAATYLLAANGQGLTLYDLRSTAQADSGVRLIPFDAMGPITAPAGVALTNLPIDLPVDGGFPGGVVAVGDRTNTDLALLRWDRIASQVDGGLAVDTTFDPRTAFLDGGTPDGGVPDAGAPDGGSGGGGGTTPGGGPMGPGIPVEHASSCTTAAGAPVLVLLLAALGLLLPRRQRR